MDSYVCPHIATPPSRISNGPSRHYLGAHQGDEDHGIDLDLLDLGSADFLDRLHLYRTETTRTNDNMSITIKSPSLQPR